MTVARSTRPSGPTLRDVARLAGVSPMTASRTLRGDEGVSAATRERVEDAARLISYRPNEIARSLRAGSRTGMVGLVVTNLANPFYSRLALGVEAALESEGLKVVLGSTGEDPTVEAKLIKELLAHRVEGMIVVPAGTDHRHLFPAALDQTPIVFAARPPQGLDADCVLVDDFEGARSASVALVAAGHRRLGFVGNPPTVYTSAERFRGFCAALEVAGVPLEPRWVSRGSTTVESARTSVEKMMRVGGGPTALFTANNRMTLGALLATRDLAPAPAVAGFDNLEYAELLRRDRQVTLIDYDADEVGRRAGSLLSVRIASAPDHRAPAVRITIPTVLRTA